MNIKESALLKGVAAELRIFESRCRSIMQQNIKMQRLGNVLEVFDMGKGIRPALHFFFSKSINKVTDINFVYAAVVEMLHFATLAHDDVLDEALLRRSNGTLKATQGNFKAVLMGDLIISLCYKIASELGNPQFLKLLSETSYNVCIGEIMQHNEMFNMNLTEKQYLDIIYYKTATLFGFSCCLADFNGKLESALYNIGSKIGVLYQIIDDFLDIYSSHKSIGKSTGKDLSKGNITLPIIMLLKVASSKDICNIKNILFNPYSDRLSCIKELLEKYKIRGKLYNYVERIYKQIMKESKSILDKKNINILSRFLMALTRYVWGT